MKFSHVKEFVKLARTLNYTQAAAELFMTQPVLSRHIAQIESELGVKLFLRSTHQVALTPAGVKALEAFEGIFSQYDSLLKALKSQATGLSGSLSIGLLYYAIDGYFESVIRPISKIAPNIDVSIVSYQPPKLAEDLLKGKIDLGLTLKPAAPLGDNVRVIDINEEKMVLLCSECHPLAKRREVEAAQLRGQRFVFMEKENWQEPHVMKILNDNNIEIAEKFYTEQIDTLTETIIDKNAVLILSSHISSMKRKSIKFLRIKHDDFKIRISAIFMADNTNPCLNIFTSWIKNNLTEISNSLKF